MKEYDLKSGICSLAHTIIKSKIDVEGGKLTFEQRITVGEIMQSEDSEIVKFENVFICLHDYKPNSKDYALLMPYFEEIIKGLVYWLEKETTMLKHEPTADEERAGIKELAANIGQLGTIKALAKAFGEDPDTILKWEYGKVFGMLYADLEEYKYQVRFNKIMEQKHKAK